MQECAVTINLMHKTDLLGKKKNMRSRRTCIAPLTCIHVIFKQVIAGDTNLHAEIYL